METLIIKVDGMRKKMNQDVRLPELIRAFHNQDAYGENQQNTFGRKKGKRA